MRRYIIFGILLFIIYCPGISSAECRAHIELHPACDIAEIYEKSEAWVLGNYKVNLWEKQTSQGKGKSVGKLLPGSRAVILEKGPEDYKVKSPLDKSVGWINKMQVKRVLKQDTITRKPCR